MNEKMETVSLRASLAGFARLMEEALARKDSRIASGEWMHWRETRMPVEYLVAKAEECLAGLRAGLALGDAGKVTHEAVDLANFAMMIEDRKGRP